ncbi:hypothetical protein NEFER03_0814 [Nematocida sp. LUAm3]|nr:hypothetical protein NEFER03_0814 [Nematocida sp. LUAm3]KAI5174832.1 hypothetical protein NEFER02_0932 [Nematocida sp. LUAm2]KAI5177570.1 hypothetical protein NEFER01_0820 [Nematocida sp. LUAm1]
MKVFLFQWMCLLSKAGGTLFKKKEKQELTMLSLSFQPDKSHSSIYEKVSVSAIGKKNFILDNLKLAKGHQNIIFVEIEEPSIKKHITMQALNYIYFSGIPDKEELDSYKESLPKDIIIENEEAVLLSYLLKQIYRENFVLFVSQKTTKEDIAFLKNLYIDGALLDLDLESPQEYFNIDIGRFNYLKIWSFSDKQVILKCLNSVSLDASPGSSSKWNLFISRHGETLKNIFVYSFFSLFIGTFLGIILFCVYTQYKRRNRKDENVLTSEEIEKMALVFYKNENPAQEQERCMICLEDYSSRSICRVLTCTHFFHHYCIDPWLMNQSSKCPYCQVKAC